MEMLPTDRKEALLAAVNRLITAGDAHELFAILDDVAAVAARQPSVELGGEAAVLNPLLQLRRQDPDAYQRVLELVDTKRQNLGYDLLRKPAETSYNKVEYMRSFMDQKRQRQRLAVEIENLLRPERDRLIGNARLEFMRRQSLRWGELRDQALAAAREQGGGSLSKDQLREVLARFWNAVDEDLERRHQLAKAEALKPAGQRQAPDLSLSALEEALSFDPYKK